MGNRALQPPVFQMKHCSHLLQCATACAKQCNRHDPVRFPIRKTTARHAAESRGRFRKGRAGGLARLQDDVG
ncbi:hypothetical protein BJS_05954 [Bradyrhizobium japonicum SEMIA 5079]|nr:hypothetical protein BJS_05954 [Bradyrhizobium japonicum SEMIA 5079]